MNGPRTSLVAAGASDVPGGTGDFLGAPTHFSGYPPETNRRLLAEAGFTLLRVEGSMYVNGHIWKLLTIPSRRRWPVCGPLVDALRMATLGALPHAALERLDRGLYHLGFGARQALVIAERPATLAEQEPPR